MCSKIYRGTSENIFRNSVSKDLVAITLILSWVFFQTTPTLTLPHPDVCVTAGMKDAFKIQAKNIFLDHELARSAKQLHGTSINIFVSSKVTPAVWPLI